MKAHSFIICDDVLKIQQHENLNKNSTGKTSVYISGKQIRFCCETFFLYVCVYVF